MCMYESILIAGSGGQGILFAGTVLAQAGLIEGKEVTFFPSYGAEIRGGTAHCTVIISDDEIGSPIVQHLSNMIILNSLSFNRFLPRLKTKGILVMNTSLIGDKPERNDIRVIPVQATRVADEELNNIKVANMVAIGAYINATPVITQQSVEEALGILLKEKKDLIQINKTAFTKGLKQLHEVQYSQSKSL